jgi:hypothetical protein
VIGHFFWVKMDFAIVVVVLICFGLVSVVVCDRFNSLDESMQKDAIGDDFD